MELKIYNKENCLTKTIREKIIRIRALGTCTFSKGLCEMMDIKIGGHVVIAEDERGCWYIANVDKDEKGFNVYNATSGTPGIRNHSLTDIMMKKLKIEDTTGYLVGMKYQEMDKVKYYPILTKSPMVYKRRNINHKNK
jgi:hypothetical protein